ncbi:MAG TPA: hypothetical protein VK563_03340 [Puia sp.]|nr:hypothetical protein [Puia sp.]
MGSIIVSILALIISLLSLIISIVQKNREKERAIRKSLSDTLESIAKINIEFSKLRQDNELFNSEGVIDLRRNYNSQRRILIAHADFLVTKYDSLTTDIDCNLLADAYSAIGDYGKADSYWIKTIEKSQSNPIEHMSLRGYARFLFFQGKFEIGRGKFEEALKIDLPETDDYKRQKADTYFMWASVEKEFNNRSEMIRLIELGKSYCKRIGHAKMRIEMEERFKRIEANVMADKSTNDIL